MDDFGSGYSSFSRLLNMPVDTLKIDQTLIRNMTNDDRNFLVIRTVIDLCAALGLRSTAEGVESVETISQLRALGCDLVQGHGIARPMAAVDAARWMVEHPIGVPIAMDNNG
jgi:EAL domain-containing protein (putative c-di-GMP-specific phosphodiesterase class I)